MIINLVRTLYSKFQALEILGISLEIPSISNSRGEKPNLRFSMELLGILIEILGFSLEIFGILKICDNHIP